MRFFRRQGCAVKKWHARALTIDPNKTRITIVRTKKAKHVPIWVYKRYAPQQLPSK